jgi:ribosomal subunit interface protein
MSRSIVARKDQRAAPTVSPVARKGSAPSGGLTVTFRHVAPTDAIREYAERKFAHMARFLKRACTAHLILTVDKYRQHGEVTVKSGRLAVTAQEETRDLYSVIDLLADKASRQLKSQQDKFKDKKLRALSAVEVLSAAEDVTPASGTPRISR